MKVKHESSHFNSPWVCPHVSTRLTIRDHELASLSRLGTGSRRIHGGLVTPNSDFMGSCFDLLAIMRLVMQSWFGYFFIYF